MRIEFKVEGFRDMEKALAELPRGTAKGVVNRVIKKTLEPVRATAESLGPFRVAVTSRLEKNQRKEAREAGETGSRAVTQYVGPVRDDAVSKAAFWARWYEFGTGPRFHESGKYVGQVAPNPFMRPAWDMHSGTMLETLGRNMWSEIEKTVARRAAKAARDAAR